MASLVSQPATFSALRVTCAANAMETTWALDSPFSRSYRGEKTLAQPPYSWNRPGLGVCGNETRKAKFNRYFETAIPPFAGVIAAL